MFGWLFGSSKRSGSWPRVRREHLAENPTCAACGRGSNLEVHHIEPVSRRPDLELERSNLLSLCSDPCHLVHGHLMSWKRANPDVVEDCRKYREKIRNFRETPETW